MKRYRLRDLSLSKLEYGSGAAAIKYDGNTRYVRITDIDDNGNLGSNIVSPSEIDEKYLLHEGDILFARTGATVGKSYLYNSNDGRCIYAGFLIRVVPNVNLVRPKYLYYFTKSDRYKKFVANSMKVVAQPNINAKQYGDLEIEVPLLDTQDSIVDKLNIINSVITNKKLELDLLDNLIKARFVEMFGDPIVNPKRWIKLQLQQLVSQDCSISYGIVQTGDDVENGIPVFRPVDIVGRIPNRAELKRTARQISDRYKRTVLKGRELLITVRANIADTYIAGTDFTGCNVGRGIVPIRTNESKIRLEFLKALIDCEVINRHIKSLAKGITLIQLNMEDLRTIELIVPPVSLQDEYIRLYKEVDKSKVVVQKSLEQTQLLFDSLMQQYFG